MAEKPDNFPLQAALGHQQQLATSLQSKYKLHPIRWKDDEHSQPDNLQAEQPLDFNAKP